MASRLRIGGLSLTRLWKRRRKLFDRSKFSRWPEALLKTYVKLYARGERLVGPDVYINIWRLAESANILASDEAKCLEKLYGIQPDEDLREAVRLMEEQKWIKTSWLDHERWHWEVTPQGLRYGKDLNRWYGRVGDTIRALYVATVEGVARAFKNQ